MFAWLRSVWRNMTDRAGVDRALDRELGAYVELLTAEKVRAGTRPDEARRSARGEAGIAAVTEAVRDIRSGALIDGIIRDIHHAARALRRTPGFTMAAMLTLGVGLGAATTIFSVVNGALLRPLPFTDAGRLILVTESSAGKARRTGAPYPDVLEWQRQATAFADMAPYWNVRGDGAVFDAPGDPERLHYTITTDRLFPVLGIRPAIGRGFLAAEMTPGHGAVFIASDALWRRAMGASPGAVGRAWQIDGTAYTLVGVLSPRRQFPDDCDIWLPLGALDGFPLDRVSHQFWVIGRLTSAVAVDHAQAELTAIERRLGAAYPETDAGWQVSVEPLLDEFVGNVRTSMLVLFGATGFIVLIACASVANLTLARALARDREFAIRTALGASRGRLVRHCLVETALISGGGLLLGLGFAAITHGALFALTSLGTSRIIDASLDYRVWAFGALLAGATSLLVGLVPAMHAIRRAPQESLRGTPGTDASHGGGRRMQRALVVTELALTVLLLAGAGLMTRSVLRLARVEPGFNPDHLLTMQIALPDALYPTRRSRAILYHELLDQISRLPGVRSAATTDELPLTHPANVGFGESFGESFNIVGRPTLDWARTPAVPSHPVSLTYFGTMEIPIVRGRAFAVGDTNVMVINRAMAERFWPGADPIDQQVVTLDEPARPFTIIGIAGDVRSAGLDRSDAPEMYYVGDAWSQLSVAIRTTGDPMAVAGAVRRTVTALDPHVPVYRMTAMVDLVSQSIGSQRAWLILLAAFAGFALAVAAIGVGGLVAFTVSQRTQEIGVRQALGARPVDIVRNVGGPLIGLVAVGIVLGLVAAAILTRLMASMLFGVAPGDAPSLATAALVVAVVALGSCYLPIRRAVRIDPLVALRRD